MATFTLDLSSRIRPDVDMGALSDGTIRYVLIRADGLMGAFVGPGQHATLAALSESVYQRGCQSLIQYQREHGSSPAVLMAVVMQMAATLGWGVWRFFLPNPHELTLSVHNSPFAAGAGTSDVAVCAPILGMVRAVGDLVLGGTVHVVEHQCVACGAGSCEFSARLAVPPQSRR